MFSKILIANRGEIAIRIARAAQLLGIPTVAIFSEDDKHSLHLQIADDKAKLTGIGAAAYLDQQQIIAVAKRLACDAIHPGYGFLSENAVFADACEAAGIRFIGPTSAHLRLFGDKVSARQFAQAHHVPVISGSKDKASLDDVKHFFEKNGGAIVIKAIAGGGGRGMRVVDTLQDIEDAYARCQSEAFSAFGCADVYAETFIRQARHIEIQMIGDRTGSVIHCWERDCTLQRRHQKILEIAPAPNLSPTLRKNIIDAAITLASEAKYLNLGTFEFLVDTATEKFYFIEANPRLQVEHTITEEITGLDLVETQLHIASGKTLSELGLLQAPPCKGIAVQARINMETMQADGSVKPQGGKLIQYAPPSGPAVRVDGYGYSGYTTNPNFDSLLAKLICTVKAPNLTTALQKTKKSLEEFQLNGVNTNRDFLWAILQSEQVAAWNIHTQWIDNNSAELIKTSDDFQNLFHTSNQNTSTKESTDIVINEQQTMIRSPLQGTVISFLAKEGDEVFAGEDIAIIDSMKMEHVIKAPINGRIEKILASPATTLFENDPLIIVEATAISKENTTTNDEIDLEKIRPDLQEAIDRHAYGHDKNRPDAVARRRKTNQRTARENIDDLIDADSFIEYGALVVAAQRARRSEQELIEKTPGDGLIGGLATVNADLFGEKASQCAVMTYDYTVFAGTQGQKNHRKKDRLFEIAEKWQLPTIVFAEGGGGRPGETERNSASGLNCLAFWYFAKMKGKCPLVGIVSGRCFAGNAVLLGCTDVVIATENANIGMGGPAMIEGGGLGVFTPEEVGPVADQRANGVIDVVVKDEEEAVSVAKKYLGYFQGEHKDWHCEDQRLLRHVIPENRLRVYDVRRVIELMSDTDSVLELRKDFAPGIITAFARIEGKPVGIVANNPQHLGGAIDSPGSDKAARFLQTCNAFNIPVVFLCDTPGIMVGPESEKTALVRHASRLFIIGAALKVPFFTIVLRKAYGLGAQTMAGGSFHAPVFTVSWPTGEFGGMGLEGAVKLAYRKEMEAIEDLEERENYFQEKVAAMYQLGKATTVASYFDLDDVIDPKDTRAWISRGLSATDKQDTTQPLSHPFIDTW